MEQESILDTIVGYIVSFGHWVVETFHHFMFWAFPNFMRFHESAIAVQKTHDPYYYLSLKWLFDFLGFVGTKIGHGLEWLFVGKTVSAWHSIESAFNNYGLLGKVILIVLVFVALFYIYAFIRLLLKLPASIYRGVSNNCRFAKLRYGTYWAITKPKPNINDRLDDITRHKNKIDPNLSTRKRIVKFIIEEPICIALIAPCTALFVVMCAYAIHYVGYVPFAFYMFAFAMIWTFKQNYKCTELSTTADISIGVILASAYLLFTNFDLGFHGYVIDAISYISGLNQPLDFDPIIYTFFFYLGAAYLVRYLIYHFYGEPMKVKAYMARGIDLCAIYDANEAKFAKEKTDRKARKKRFK